MKTKGCNFLLELHPLNVYLIAPYKRQQNKGVIVLLAAGLAFLTSPAGTGAGPAILLVN
jgi:hypothetical protein